MIGPLGLLVLLVVNLVLVSSTPVVLSDTPVLVSGAPVVVSGTPESLPVDCSDLYSNGFGNSGVYTIFPAGPTSPVQVFCEMGSMDAPDSNKWTVIQRRTDGTINFYRGWEQYKTGFGQASSEYWLGLENIHLLSGKKSYKLRVDMEDFDGAKVSAEYSSFNVAPEKDGYRLTLSGFKDGGAGDSLAFHNGQKFSTFDKDQDSDPANCAETYLGGWWYNNCHGANANGEYLWGESIVGLGINWFTWKGNAYSLKAIAFKLSPQLELDAKVEV
ncbi:microfibril-associated glycoprotein 4-like isoform X2 [Gadus macrocephalus]|uniref:microfibril-associated glycoprotein 4-like isoform X2 n=1 Tax=Gadus macrocephalus TaxID=80720 RepID=UPI0028CBBBF5|nr:microfibril-associated glycoprotein 4-like isoform X2 [Gadus macrocephalus]